MVILPILASVFFLILTSRLDDATRAKFDAPVRMAAFIISLAMFTVATLMFLGQIGDVGWNDITFNTFEFQESYVWIEQLDITWTVGVDGLSFPMVWLTTLLMPITIIATWNEKAGATYFPLMLMLGGALIGVFVALDMFMFYVFWELTLIPMFFMILKWGGKDRKYAAQKFFIYTFTASVIMLLGLLTMYFLMDTQTFSMQEMVVQASGANANGVWLGLEVQKVLFIMLMLGFLVKLPAAPFHTWLPDAHVQAPTGGSMMLAGVMLKMGAYGMFRLPISLFPHALEEFQFVIMMIGLVSLVWGAIVCLGQTNLKKMVAYSSVSHMGVILLGIASMQPVGWLPSVFHCWQVSLPSLCSLVCLLVHLRLVDSRWLWAAALFMMFAHGIISPMLFAVCGAFKHHYHSMEIGAMRGMAKHSPWLATSMMFGWMASLGLPLLAGFVAEFMLMVAYWYTYGWWILLPALVLAITAAYYLWSMQRTIFEGGEATQPPESLHGEPVPDIDNTEKIAMLLLAAFTILFGIMPWIFLDMMDMWTRDAMKFLFDLGGV